MKPQADCHIHMILDAVYWRAALDRHRVHPDAVLIRQRLAAYQKAGVTYLRDGGDRWGVCQLAAALAPAYGITYAMPLAPLYPAGHYGGFLGRSFQTVSQYRQLVQETRRSGGHFIKLILSGLMDFRHYGMLTEPPLPCGTIAVLIDMAHDAGMPVMVHCNGAAAAQAVIAAGADSLEHGAYLEDETIAALAASETIWVPTFSPIGNLIGSGRYPDNTLHQILETQMQRVRQAFLAGAQIACGSDAGAYRAAHVQAICDEWHYLAQALQGLTWQTRLLAAGQRLQTVFSPRSAG